MKMNRKKKGGKRKESKEKSDERWDALPLPIIIGTLRGREKKKKSSDQPEIKKRTDPPPFGGKEASPFRSFGTPQREEKKEREANLKCWSRKVIDDLTIDDLRFCIKPIRAKL